MESTNHQPQKNKKYMMKWKSSTITQKQQLPYALVQKKLKEISYYAVQCVAAASLAALQLQQFKEIWRFNPGSSRFSKSSLCVQRNGSIPLCDHLEIETLAATAAVTLNFLFRKTFSPYVDFSLLYFLLLAKSNFFSEMIRVKNFGREKKFFYFAIIIR